MAGEKVSQGREAAVGGRDPEAVYAAMREIEGRVDEPLLLRAIDRVGVEGARALVAGETALRRACCERVCGLGSSEGELGEALVVIGAAGPQRVDEACDLIRPSEPSVRRRIAKRRRAGVGEGQLERAIAALGAERARGLLGRRDCYWRLVELACDPGRSLSEREAALTLAAGEYEAARALVGARRFAELGRGRRTVGLEQAARRRELPVGEALAEVRSELFAG